MFRCLPNDNTVVNNSTTTQAGVKYCGVLARRKICATKARCKPYVYDPFPAN